jgi:osmotically-inducible protein OsmY
MKSTQPVGVLKATLGAAAISLAFSAAAATSSDRSADEQSSVDRQATIQQPQRNDRVATQTPATTESGDLEDRRLVGRVQAALNDDPELKQAMLRVQADNGKVRLVGSVNTFEQKDRAIQIASAVHGVSGVDDGITLRERVGASR